MSVIPIEVALAHLRLDDDTDRTMVDIYLAAAEDSAAQFLNRQFYPDQAALTSATERGDADSKAIVIEPSIRSAVLLILGDLYENRGDDPSADMPKVARRLLDPYRVELGV